MSILRRADKARKDAVEVGREALLKTNPQLEQVEVAFGISV